jgi:hypothetical protein
LNERLNSFPEVFNCEWLDDVVVASGVNASWISASRCKIFRQAVVKKYAFLKLELDNSQGLAMILREMAGVRIAL